MAEGSDEILIKIAGIKAAGIILPGSDGQNNRPVSSPWQNKAFVIISMFADQIDPAGRSYQNRLATKFL